MFDLINHSAPIDAPTFYVILLITKFQRSIRQEGAFRDGIFVVKMNIGPEQLEIKR